MSTDIRPGKISLLYVVFRSSYTRHLPARMVCIPCIVVPVLLFIWHRFLQPIFLKFWNPFKKVTNSSDKKSEESNASNGCPAANGTVKTDGGISCPFSGKKEINSEEIAGDKKDD